MFAALAAESVRAYHALVTRNRAGGAGAVVSVALLGETMPDYFGTFDVAMFSLFSVTGGEPWPETLPRLNEDGTANWGVMLFCAAYFVITTWLILQVLGRILSCASRERAREALRRETVHVLAEGRGARWRGVWQVSFTVLLDNYIAASAQMAVNRRILEPDVAKQQVGWTAGAK